MRPLSLLVVPAVLMVVSAPVFAGNLTFADGKAQWQATGCTEPLMPPALATVSSETHASDMNILMESYNAYAGKMQEYMKCLSSEAETDSGVASQAVISSAQEIINAAQQKVNGLHDTLQPPKK